MTNEQQSDFRFTESPYSASKIAGEALIYSYARCYNMPYIVFRFSNVYGKYKTLDFTYIDDCVEGIIASIEKLAGGKIKNETINLAYGEGHTLLELVNYICENFGKTCDTKIEAARLGEVTHYVADIGKAKSLLGYNPKTNLKDGIGKAVAWWKEYYKAS